MTRTLTSPATAAGAAGGGRRGGGGGGLPPAPGARGVRHGAGPRRACGGGGRGRRKLLGRRRCRHSQVSELLQQELDRLRVGPFMDTVERRPVPPAEAAGAR